MEIILGTMIEYGIPGIIKISRLLYVYNEKHFTNYVEKVKDVARILRRK